MECLSEIENAVGEVLDPHLPFGLKELGMLESVELDDNGDLSVVISMPCHHCPGLQSITDDIRSKARKAGVRGGVRVSFHGHEAWQPMHISEPVRKAMLGFGLRAVARDDSDRGKQ